MKYDSASQLRQLVVEYQKASIPISILYPALNLITRHIQSIVDSSVHKYSQNYLLENMALVITPLLNSDELMVGIKKNLSGETNLTNINNLLLAYKQLRSIFMQESDFYKEHNLFEGVENKQLYLSTVKEILSNHIKKIINVLTEEKTKTYLTDPLYIMAEKKLNEERQKNRMKRLKRAVLSSTPLLNDERETRKVVEEKKAFSLDKHRC